MADRFVFIRKSGEPSRAVSLSMVMAAARLRIASGMVDYHLRKNELPPGPALSRSAVLKRLRARCKGGAVGDRFRVYADPGDGPVFVVHKVQPSMTIIDINGNDHADFYYSWVLSMFEGFKPRYAGSYVCKDIAGSSTPSQHSYGNAVDFFFDSLAHQDVVFDAAIADADALHLAHAISRQTIWERGVGKQPYGGEYHSHLHTDYEPQFSGPCGVREP